MFHHPIYDNMVEGSNLGNLRYYETKEEIVPIANWQKSGKLIQMIIHLRKDGHKKTFGVHSIILPCFIPNTLNKSTINHKDRDPSTNRVSNLRYATRTEQNHNSGSKKALLHHFWEFIIINTEENWRQELR